MIKKKSLLRKYGFYRVLDILSTDGSKIPLMLFLEKLNEKHYYNMFLRVKKELLEKKIISIDYNTTKKRKTIHLTNNGIILKLRIKEIINQLENPIKNTEITQKDIINKAYENLAQIIRKTIKQEILEDTNYLTKLTEKLVS